MTSDISYIGMILGLLLMLLPLYFFFRFKTGQIISTLIATARMVVQLLLIGLHLKYLFLWNNPFINILWVFIMVIVAAFTGVHRAHLRFKTMLIPLICGFFASAFAVGMFFLVFVLQLRYPFDARYFVPVMGILMGNMLSVCVIGLTTFYDGLHREQGQYYYLLGNGASRIEAVTPFLRKALDKSFAPCIANMAVMGIVSLPGTMIGQILGGSAPGIAIKYQMMIIVITFTASILALMLTIYLSERKRNINTL